MAKLDKAQQQYALRRVDQLAREAKGEDKYNYRNERDAKDEVVKATLEAKGFKVISSYGISDYVEGKLPAAYTNKLVALEKRKQVIDAAAQAARDNIMLGEIGEVVDILAQLAKDLAKLKG